MSEEYKSRLVKVVRYLVLAVFFLLALGLVSVSYTASLAVVLGVVLAWPAREIVLSIADRISNLGRRKKTLTLALPLVAFLLLIILVTFISIINVENFASPVTATSTASMAISDGSTVTATPTATDAAVLGPPTVTGTSTAWIPITPSAILQGPTLTGTPIPSWTATLLEAYTVTATPTVPATSTTENVNSTTSTPVRILTVEMLATVNAQTQATTEAQIQALTTAVAQVQVTAVAQAAQAASFTSLSAEATAMADSFTSLSAEATAMADSFTSLSAEATSIAVKAEISTAVAATSTAQTETSTAMAVIPTPTVPTAVAEYQVEITQSDAEEFNIKEKLFTDEDELIYLQERMVKSKSQGLILRELHITPLEISTSTFTDPNLSLSQTNMDKESLCIRRCPKSMIKLFNFPLGSFYEADGDDNLEKEEYGDKERISFSVDDLDRGITFSYIPAPYHDFSLPLIPFIEITSFSPWLTGLFVGFIVALFVNPIPMPLLPYINKGRRKEGADRQPASANFDLLSQATCAVLIDDEIAGTAWLVSNEGHLITAGHVLGEDEPLPQVTVQFEGDYPRIAHRIRSSFQQAMGIDFAILQLETQVHQRQPLPISLASSVEGKCRLVGYGHTLSDPSQGMGEFIGPVNRQGSSANRLFRLRSPELGEEGYSGGAVFSEELEAVVAIQTETTNTRLGAGRDTVLAMPLYRVAHHWTRLVELAGEGEATSRWRLGLRR